MDDKSNQPTIRTAAFMPSNGLVQDHFGKELTSAGVRSFFIRARYIGFGFKSYTKQERFQTLQYNIGNATYGRIGLIGRGLYERSDRIIDDYVVVGQDHLFSQSFQGNLIRRALDNNFFAIYLGETHFPGITPHVQLFVPNPDNQRGGEFYQRLAGELHGWCKSQPNARKDLDSFSIMLNERDQLVLKKNLEYRVAETSRY